MEPSGRILAFNGFQSGAILKNLVRLQLDGTLDNSFQPVPSEYVPVTAPLPDGRIFATVVTQGLSGNAQAFFIRIIRVFPDGTIDPTFDAPIATDMFNRATYVTSLAAMPDGGVAAGGSFGLRVFKADSTEDTRFQGKAPFSPVFSLLLQVDGKLLVAGQNAPTVLRLNTDGSIDTSFNAQVSRSFQPTVYAIAQQPDGKILIGGTFDQVSGQPRNRIARLHADGSLDPSFDPGSGTTLSSVALGNPSIVTAVAIQPDGNIVIGGQFSKVNDIPRRNLARLFGGELPERPLLLAPALRNGTFEVSVRTRTNQTYQMEYKDLLTLTNWTKLGTVAGDGTRQLLVDPNPSATQRFYRVIVE